MSYRHSYATLDHFRAPYRDGLVGFGIDSGALPDPLAPLECLARGSAWMWQNGQCVPAAHSGWGEAACKASGGQWIWDGVQWQCINTPEQQASSGAFWVQQQACALFGGTYSSVSGECLYPSSAEGLVRAQQGSCASGQVQTASGCMAVSPAGSSVGWKTLVGLGAAGLVAYWLWRK